MRCVVLALALLSSATAHVYAQPGDWTVKRDPFDRTLIARYKQMLTRDPHDRMALSALLSLYKRHRTVELLVREYGDTLAKAESAATLVVLGRLARHGNDMVRAKELYTRAGTIAPKDTKVWLALGELHAASGNRDESRAAFAKASTTATTPALQKLAARALLDATHLSGDHVALEAAFEALLKLTPKDGRLWAERADAQLAAGKTTDAIDTYKKAEELLARDPERKLLAITARALAFDKAGKPDLAIAEYKRAQAASPPGYYLRRELVFRIIDVFRRHHTLAAALEYLDREWPTKKRGAFEWGTLADLHKEATDTAMMVYSLEQAVKADPRAVALQWKLIKHYDAAQESVVALAILETAAAASPSDASLHLELAQRLWRFEGPHRRRALDVAKRLSAARPRDVETHRALTEVFSRFGRIDLAIEEARKVATLEPGDDSWAMLGDALNAAGRQSDAITTWKKIAASGTPAALQRVADIFLDNSLWMEAVDAYTEAMFGDLTNAMLWRGRAVALANMGRLNEGRIDAEHAVKLLGLAPYDKGHEVRFQLVNILRQEAIQEAFGDETIEPDLWVMSMDKAFTSKKAPDLQAGYLLAEYYRRKPDESLMIVLERLHELVPADLGIAGELVRVYRQLEKLDRAITMVRWLAAADPTRKQELAELESAIERSRPVIAARQEQEERAAAYFGASCAECRYQDSQYTLGRRLGVRLGVGDSMRGRTAGTITLGARLLHPLHDELALMTRVEWVRRTLPAQTVLTESTLHAVGASVGLAYPLAASDKGTMMLGAAWRTELRLGDTMDRRGHDRLGLAADATLELFPDAIPASLGMRLEQSLSEDASSTTFLLEATFDWR